MVSKASIRRRMARVRRFRRKSSRKPINTNKRQSKPMARRRTRRVSRGIRRGIGRIGSARGKFGSFLKSGTIGDTTQALGAGLVIGAVTDRVMPQVTPFASAAGEYLAGGVKGMVIAELIKPIIGLPSILPNITSGFGGLFGGQTASTPTEAI